MTELSLGAKTFSFHTVIITLRANLLFLSVLTWENRFRCGEESRAVGGQESEQPT